MPKKKQTPRVEVATRHGLFWKIHTPKLLEEIVVNGGPAVSMMAIPIQYLARVLYSVGARAKQLNDPMLNALMMQLTIYTVADPTHEDYNAEVVNQYMKEHLP